MQEAVERYAERIRAAAVEKKPLRLRGGGSKDFYGEALQGEVLDTRDYAGIVAYEPTELVITVRCGTPLVELESVLRAQGQYLAFEPPHFGDAATVGGMIAAGLSGPRRQAAGAVRDFVLGVRILDGRGDDLSFGGQVMKNVAGYDVSRPLAGSLGTLGLILEVSLKVPPMPIELGDWTVVRAGGDARMVSYALRAMGMRMWVSSLWERKSTGWATVFYQMTPDVPMPTLPTAPR